MKQLFRFLLLSILTQSTFGKVLAGGFHRHLPCTGSLDSSSSYTNISEDSAHIQQASIDMLTHRFINALIIHKPDERMIKSLIQTMLDDGSWNDVVYADTSITNWLPMKHLERLKMMAIAYSMPGDNDFNNAMLRDKILLGLKYFYQRKPVSGNWWYRDIGAPQNFMQPLLLLKGKIDNSQLLYLSSYLKDATGNKSHQGKNRSWVSEITIYKGCIENNFALVSKGITSMASTLVVVHGLNDEGIKADFSYHQHHAQLYSGGYGMSVIDDYATYMLLVKQTAFENAFPPEKRMLLADLLLQGHQLLGYRHAIDFGAAGRNISRAGGTSSISAGVLDKMSMADPTHANAYATWKKHLEGKPFAAPGNKFFWNSAIMTQHGVNYYLSAKILTSRTYGTESLNNENIKAFNLPIGATNILTTGNEYSNIFPVWDWSRIPGTTAELNPAAAALKGYQTGKNEFGGGVSNATSGLIAFEQDYHDVKARKAYFFINDLMLCLGAGIRADKENDVVTSVNQTYLSGDILMGAGSKDMKFTGSHESYQNLTWLYHNKVGYIFPEHSNVTVQNIAQSGSWHDLNLSGTDSVITAQVFSIWFNHGKKPSGSSYSYMVAPGLELNQIRRLAVNNPFVILKNDTLVQAVYNTQSHVYAIVFYKPATITLHDGLIISSDQKAMVLLERQDKGYRLSVADPVYALSSLKITVNKVLKGLYAEQHNQETMLTFPLPHGDEAGKTVTQFYQ